MKWIRLIDMGHWVVLYDYIKNDYNREGHNHKWHL